MKLLSSELKGTTSMLSRTKDFHRIGDEWEVLAKKAHEHGFEMMGIMVGNAVNSDSVLQKVLESDGAKQVHPSFARCRCQILMIFSVFRHSSHQ